MKSATNFILHFAFLAILAFTSCKKDNKTDSHPPVANAGPDIDVYLPTNFTVLDGSSSMDPDNDIVRYEWSFLTGPSSPKIIPSAFGKPSQARLEDLIEGTYEFELTVTDADARTSKDRALVKVLPPAPDISACDGSARSVVFAQLTPFAKLGAPRAGMAAVAVGDKMIFVGGEGGTYYGDGASGVIDVVNINTQSTFSTNLSVPRRGVGVTTSGNKIYCAGGDDGDPYFGTYYSTVEVLDLATNIHSQLSPLSQARSFVAAATIGSKLFFAGGYTNSFGAATDKVDIYDLDGNSWSSAQLSEARGCITPVVINNKIYFAGGNNHDQYSTRVDVYDNATNSWSVIDIPELEGGWYAGAAVNGKIYWANKCKMDVFDPATNTSNITYLSQNGYWRYTKGQNVVVRNNQLIFLRHDIGDGSRFDIYDLTSGKWTVGYFPYEYFTIASILCVNNSIYIAGGLKNASVFQVTDKVWKLEF